MADCAIQGCLQGRAATCAGAIHHLIGSACKILHSVCILLLASTVQGSSRSHSHVNWLAIWHIQACRIGDVCVLCRLQNNLMDLACSSSTSSLHSCRRWRKRSARLLTCAWRPLLRDPLVVQSCVQSCVLALSRVQHCLLHAAGADGPRHACRRTASRRVRAARASYCSSTATSRTGGRTSSRHEQLAGADGCRD
jgi:hypothetical protein